MFYPQSAHIIARAGRGWIYCGSPTATSTWSSKKKVNGVGRPIATGDTGTRAVYVLGLPPCAHTPRFFCATLSPPLAGDTLRCAVYVLGLPPCAHTPRFFFALRYRRRWQAIRSAARSMCSCCRPARIRPRQQFPSETKTAY